LNSEREELKRRIQFLATTEKGQCKHLNLLQKHERTVRNEFVQLNEQYQRLVKYVDSEKQLHQQAMEKVDDFQHQLEQICVERSKTEFEIQTLKEEVKLMQTTKEFLNEERETIISTQTEANEYLLSRLNESITRIREDFHQLNQTQLQQIENDYKQIFQTLEETQQTTNTSPHIILSEHERLQDEHQIVLQEFTTLNDHNQILSARVLAMVCSKQNFFSSD
jgi:chromosome segregation ATPase